MVIDHIGLLHHSLPGTWKDFEDVCKRIRAFSNQYEADADVEVLLEFVRFNFMAKAPSSLVIAAYDEEGLVCGHLLAIAEVWFGRRVVTVVQVQSDEPLNPAVWEQSEEALNAFSRYHQAVLIQIAARSKAAARLFSRHGFVEKAVLMKRNVDV
jgi:hypothetical protein